MPKVNDWSRTVFLIIAYISFGVIVAVVWYAALSSLTETLPQVGFALVNVEFPPPSISPVYMKPITYLYIASLAFLFSELELNKTRIVKFPPWAKNLCKFFAFMVAAVFFYEICYNFVLWGGEIAAALVFGQVTPDILANKYPALKEPWNLVFATKLWGVFFIAGIYSFWYFSRLERERIPDLGPPQEAGASAPHRLPQPD